MKLKLIQLLSPILVSWVVAAKQITKGPNFAEVCSYQDLDIIVDSKWPILIFSGWSGFLSMNPDEWGSFTRKKIEEILQGDPSKESPEQIIIERIAPGEKDYAPKKFAIKNKKTGYYLRADHKEEQLYWTKHREHYEVWDIVILPTDNEDNDPHRCQWLIKSNKPRIGYLNAFADWDDEVRGIPNIDHCCTTALSSSIFELTPIPHLVDFDFDSSRMVVGDPHTISTGHIIVDNRCLPGVKCEDQSKTFNVQRSFTDSYTFTKAVGLSIEAGIEIEVDLPAVAKVTGSLKVTESTEFTWGKTHTVTKTFSVSDPCVGIPNFETICSSYVTKSTMNVPWKATWSNGMITSGEMAGTKHYDGRTKVEVKHLDGAQFSVNETPVELF